MLCKWSKDDLHMTFFVGFMEKIEKKKLEYEMNLEPPLHFVCNFTTCKVAPIYSQ